MATVGELLHNRQIVALSGYRFVSRLYFYLPVLVVILLGQGLSLWQSAVVVAVHGVTIMLLKTPLESPGLKTISANVRLVAGEIVKALGVAGLAFGTVVTPGNLAVLVFSQVLGGLGFALTAGTDSGMLHQILRGLRAEEHYRDVETRTQSYGFIAFLGSGVIGGFATTHSIATPLILSIPAGILAAATVFGFRVPSPARSAPSEAVAASAGNSASRLSWASHLQDAWSLVVFYALIRGVILTMFVWVVPVALFVTLHVPVAFFGLILGLYTLTGFVVAQYTKQITARVGETRLLLVGIPVCMIAGILLLMLDLPILYVVIPVIVGVAAAFIRPLSYSAIAKRHPSHRAEIVSAAETLLGIVNAALVLTSAIIMQTSKLGLPLLLLALVGVAFLAGVVGERRPGGTPAEQPEARNA